MKQSQQDQASDERWKQWLNPVSTLPVPFAVDIFICFPKRRRRERGGKEKEQFGRLHDRWKRPKMCKCISHDFLSKQSADFVAQPLHQ